MGDYCLDDFEFPPSGQDETLVTTIGEFVEGLLVDEKYFETALPRIPATVKKHLEEMVAPLSQYRRRYQANLRHVKELKRPGTLVEACSYGDWMKAEIVSLDSSKPTRLHVKVRLEDGSEEHLHLGKVILRDSKRNRSRSRSGSNSRSRSRSPKRRASSPDWSRHKGKSNQELVEELRSKLRDRAVCGSGKEYARRVAGFDSSLGLKRNMGGQSARLYKEDLTAPPPTSSTKKREQLHEEDQVMKKRNDEHSLQHQKKMQELYEKYVSSKRPTGATSSGASSQDMETPDVLRLG